MPLVDLPEDAEVDKVVARIDAWAARELSDDGSFGLVAADRQDVNDRTATHRWLLRFKGDEKDFITVWLTLRQRTLQHEAQFMPVPDENVTEVLQYLMRRNTELYGMSFCLGPEDAVYFSSAKCLSHWSTTKNSTASPGPRSSTWTTIYPTAMTLGHPNIYSDARGVDSSSLRRMAARLFSHWWRAHGRRPHWWITRETGGPTSLPSR